MTHDQKIYEFAETAVNDLDTRSQAEHDKCVRRIADALQGAFDDVMEELQHELRIAQATS